MRVNQGGLLGICLLLLFCQLPKIDAKKKLHTAATWSEWSEGECSRTCGGGVRKASRTCMNNRSDGRFHCEGPSTQYTSCNTQDCPDRIDFRALQCSMFNKKQMKWKPYYGDNANPCALVCAVNRTYHAKLADKVVDGTRCRPEGYDMCVDGECKKAGCDRLLDSTVEEDACGVCGGEGKDCKTVKGDYKHKKYEGQCPDVLSCIRGYKDIITILKGATNIHIHEPRNTKNYFAVRNVFGKFYLNSQWKLAPHKKFVAAGTMFRYQKDSSGQLLMARGPTTEALTLVLVGKGDSAKVHYEYYIPEKGHTSKPLERKRKRRPKGKHMPHDTELPQHSQEEPQGRASLTKTRADYPSNHETLRRTIRDQVIPSADTPQPSGDAPPSWDPRGAGPNYQWVHGTWTECSTKCGEGMQRRAVQCYDMNKRVPSDGKCHEEERPVSTQRCEAPCDTPYQWKDSGWTECSQSCGGGVMSSISICEELSKSGSQRVEEKHCEDTLGPSQRVMKVCNEQPCADAPVPTELRCWETLYGCCPDRRTAASGPDHAGCEERHADCHNTKYGCCPDGATAARGPRYAGCPSGSTSRELAPVPTAVSALEDKHFCLLEGDTGRCTDYESKWSYNATLGRCLQFWYGGCGGNDNRFDDERACLVACRGQRTTHTRPKPTITSPRRVPSTAESKTHPHPNPTRINICEMKVDVGSCGEYEIKWFYNTTTRRCEKFWYGGCHGNDNRFDTDRDCQEKCRRSAPECVNTRFGCCEDGVTTARGPQRLGCPESDCQRSTYGCCPDGVTASRGQEHEGCPTRDCQASKYGCCRDGASFAKGENYQGCRPLRCNESPYGCCPDGVSFAQGDNYAGCREINECERTEYGCCPDQRTTAQGPNGEGCCHYTEFGCCPDGLTISGPNHERCRTQDCRRSKYGCCRDGVNFARGENFKGCPSTDCRTSAAGCCPDGVTFVSEGCAPPDCHATSYGCCPDGQTIARGYFHEGCREKDCRESRYGCCPDGVSYAKGEDYGGCPTCRETKYGCCPDGTTVARGDNYLGCTLGSCHLSDYGCCPDMRTAALGPEHLGCKDKNCRQYRYGCCDDGVTYARGMNMDGCPKRVGGCAGTRYGCCEDRRTAAQGPDRHGCPETRCEHAEFGCCEDGVTFARGRNFEGCPRRIGGCAGTRHGCCEDGRTAAQGPDRHGCPETRCEHAEFGCCEDGVTFARGRNFEGCPRRIGGCAGTRHGCCEDGRTAAQGPDRHGCPETRCEHAEFGCCEDGVTFARGRNFEGCPRRVGGCAGTRHGCCEDGRTAAQGPDRYGCPETRCENAEFGCCEDGVTFARGRNFEGCPRRVGGCAGTRHGCCEDGSTAAQGPDRYGCPETRCDLSEHGCCPDGRTFARGPNHDGCRRRDCNRSRYGCCPDGVSFAQGQNNAGCEIDLGCEASAYGCCPDMVTAARGPEYAGCPPGGCRSTRYGCCPDGTNSADGPNYAGCELRTDCESSRFGCCPDRKTAARGPDYAGCVVPTPSSEVDCESDRDAGSCSEYEVKWFFNQTSSRCEQFWYGSCGGNNNRYENERECDRKCRRRRGSLTTAAPLDPCRLPYDEGTCSSSNAVRRWYYEESSRSCQVFWYSGCDGNGNNFESESSCVQRCFLHDPTVTATLTPTEPSLSRDPLEICHLELQAGVCSKELIMWHYDKQDGLCKNFTYTGCYGNSNRFPSKENCEEVCSREAVCNFKEAYGTCQSNIQRYRYDAERGDCVAFSYSGCDGNANNFVTLDACRTKCGVLVQPTVATTTAHPVETEKPPGLAACSLEKAESVCPDGTRRPQIAWYYDLTLAVCQQFNYSGCGGNNNKFYSAEECTRTCNPRDICQMPNDSGVCLAYSEFWYYNKDSKKCETFVYGGCGGNANRFATKSTCKRTCRALMLDPIGKPIAGAEIPTQEKTKDACLLPQKPGTCYSPVDEAVWFYNMTEGICQLFDAGGCNYNDNKFSSREDCERTCDPRELCTLPKDSGTCYAYSKQFYFNPTTKRCEDFVYGGCGGNANRFPSVEYCEKACNALMDRGVITGPEKFPDDVKIAILMCHLRPEKGPCESNERKWYYEVKEARCRQFTFGGCQGNQNRFDTKEQCENICSPQVVCSFSRDTGNCTPYHRGYYFNSAVGRCEHLSYGDCPGNANRFYTAELCQRTCKGLIEPTEVTTSFRPPLITTPRPEPTMKPTVAFCHLEKKIGDCEAQISAWYYDSEELACKHFYYGGCDGNGNRFKSREECESICNPYDICNLPKESGSCYAYSEQYYFNPQTRRCEKFVYGACGGNANRFASLAKCQALCHSLIERTTTQPTVFTKSAEACHLEKKVGPCRAQLPAWHYDAVDHQCKQFKYGGCQGNANLFESSQECHQTCNPQSICTLPKESGKCYAYSEQYYFNARTRRCEQFVYGGCGGNANRFSSAAQCQDVCKSLIDPDIPQTTPTPTGSPAEICHLEKNAGPCRAKLPAWHYDAVDHECKQFKYGGCQGNANLFQSSQECHQTCNPRSICTLPKESGKCYAYSEQYYFNARTRRCEQFVYGGCGGNANRFSSIEKCMDVCKSLIPTDIPQTTPAPTGNPADICHLEKEVGPCRAKLPAWHYDAVDHQCKRFKYGGCQGNANLFQSSQECHQICNSQSICTLPKESGKCYAYSEQYYFNARTRRCEQFVYGGCGGNANRFSSVEKCMDVCKSLIPTDIPRTTPTPTGSPAEICHLEKNAGPCRAQLPAWHYDAVDHECKQFKYGGCQGNANLFQSSHECHQTCNPQSICTLQKESGKCYAYSEQYYFNARTRRCEQFVYGGCGGNANRFSSVEKCMDICKSLIPTDIPRTTPTPTPTGSPGDICHLEKEVGPCRAKLPAWHYDAVDHECKQFRYGGCQGNANLFQSSQECHQTCNPQSICTLPKESGKCYAYSEQYYFNARTRRCEQFVYGGCGGNANRFSSAEKCMNICKSLIPTEIPETTPQPHVNPELCQLPRDSGPCFNYSEIYYFDQETNRCEQFVYGGCDGNANRFQSHSECRRVCRPVQSTKKPVTKIDVTEAPKRDKEVCRLRKLIGPCSYNITAWHFDEEYGVCSMFTYSGCGGNKNNFKTLEECENVCQPTNDVCNHPMAMKQCQSSRSFWFYDRANQTCRYIPTGYCEDSPFHFTSESMCQKQCVHQDSDANDVCHFRMEEGPCRDYTRVWYYNMDEAICKPFIYGGCDGNKNRFDTKQRCERVCNKHAICKLRKDSGICYGYIDAYYFNQEKNMCEHFVYGGCGGNANRFSSMNQCRDNCGGHISNNTDYIDRKEPGKCQLEPDSGYCQERNLFWYYDFKTGVCSRFYYTGCGGNDNRFATEKDCLASCKSLIPMTTYAPVTENTPDGNPKNRFTTIHVAPKQTLTLHCGELIDSTKEGNPVTWTHEGQDIVPNARRQIQNLNLVVYDVTKKDVGMYSCREKSNTVTPTLDKFKVIIKVPVTIEYGPSHMSAFPNKRLAIPCQAHGVPKPLITWYKDDQQLRSDNHYNILDNGTLLIDPFTTNDVATYKCLARNGYEGKAEKDVKVTIQDSLKLEIKKSSQNHHVGDKITLTCIADGYPNTRLQWFYKDRELYSNNHITVRDGVLSIRNATYDDSGIYTCRGTHGSDKVDKDESLRIKSRPDEVPKVCEDKLPINRCRMIVAAKLCKRKTFHKNCCVSCSRSMAFRR